MFLTLFTVLMRVMHLILGIGTPQNFPPPLSASEERDCFLKAEEGDETARQKLILHNLRLVSHIVRKYYSTANNSEDLVSIGTLGLVKAVDSFKISTGTKFATYAARCIQNEILMSMRAKKKFSAEVSLDDTIDVDNNGNPLTYIDVISSDESLEAEVERKISSAKAMRLVGTILSPREKQIILLRYGLAGKKALTQREVAEKLKISRSYVSRIEKTALEKLRAALSNY